MATEGARERGIPWTPSMSLRSIRQQTTVWSDNSHHDDSRKWLPPTSSSQLNCYLRSLLKIEPPLRSGLETHMTIIQFRYKPVSNAAPGDTAYSLRFSIRSARFCATTVQPFSKIKRISPGRRRSGVWFDHRCVQRWQTHERRKG